MAEVATAPRLRNTARRNHPIFLVLVVGALALFATFLSFSHDAPDGRWIGAIFTPDLHDMRQVVIHYSDLPRLIVSLLSGAALGLAGVIFQQVLRNPLAEPTTLGVSAGAQLALVLATLFAPWLLRYGQEWIALAGAGLATLLVFVLAWGQTFSSAGLILAGLVVTLYSGAFGSVLSLFNSDLLRDVFIWGTGSLDQNDWRVVMALLPRVAIAACLASLLLRPLAVMTLDDENARSLGLSLRTIRLLALALAVTISAFVVSAVGVIGFVGLAAPNLARLTGARRFHAQLFWSPLLGAVLLWLTDQSVQLFGDIATEVPTGTATAILGAPLLLWLLPRLHTTGLPSRDAGGSTAPRLSRPWPVVGIGVVLVIILGWLALDFGAGLDGWHFSSWSALEPLLHLRAPRVGAALAAGAMLAVAGGLMQRLTGNPMASPEVLGISSGAMLGVIVLMLAVPATEEIQRLVAATVGAAFTLAAMLLLGRRSAFSPERMLLTGIAVGTIVIGLAAVLMASGDPRMQGLPSWMAGSTYHVTPSAAIVVASIAVVMIVPVLLLGRWLDILPLGETAAKGLGIGIISSRFALLGVASVLTASATLIVGPLTFVGLMGPHVARMLGLQRPLPQLAGAACLGALIMGLAGWLGRNILFPQQVPAGLLAAFVGGPYFMWLLRRGRS